MKMLLQLAFPTNGDIRLFENIFLGYFCYFLATNEQRTLSYIDERLYINYKKNFVYVSPGKAKEEKKKTYIFSLPEDGITFEVYYWFGPAITPWGEIPFYRVRHIRDTFPEAVTSEVINESGVGVIDLDNSSIADAVVIIQNLITMVEDKYHYLGIDNYPMSFDVIVKYQGKEYSIPCNNKDEVIIRNVISYNIAE